MTEYTREQILSMQAGRELDALIAKMVMELIVSYTARGVVIVEKGTINVIPLPQYSTDISAAWEVVEKLDKEVTVKRFEGMAGWRYWCRVNGADVNRYDEKIAHGATAPEAICKAALLAVMGL